MEVHHHPHVEKKNFKEYFLEFLMIFLAVTLGFFAENIRQHFAEEKIGRQYLVTFKDELLSNRSLYNKYDSMFTARIPIVDSLINCFIYKTENKNLQTTARLIATTRRVFVSTIDKSAYEEMVNSGGLKYIVNPKFRDSLVRYAALIQNFEKYNEIVDNYRSSAFPNVSNIEPLYSISVTNPYDAGIMAPFPELTQGERTEILNFYSIYRVRYISDKVVIGRLSNLNNHLLSIVEKELNK